MVALPLFLWTLPAPSLTHVLSALGPPCIHPADIRDIDQARRDEIVSKIKASAEEIAARRKVRAAFITRSREGESFLSSS